MNLTYRNNLPWILDNYLCYKDGVACISHPIYAPFGEWYEATPIVCEPVIEIPEMEHKNLQAIRQFNLFFKNKYPVSL